MRFDVYHFIILDDGSIFKDLFVAICKALVLDYDIVTKRNYKGLTVKTFTDV